MNLGRLSNADLVALKRQSWRYCDAAGAELERRERFSEARQPATALGPTHTYSYRAPVNHVGSTGRRTVASVSISPDRNDSAALVPAEVVRSPLHRECGSNAHPPSSPARGFKAEQFELFPKP